MTQQHEKLSALMDGELHDESLLNHLTGDADLQARWQRYHLIRQGLRKELPSNVMIDVSASVAEALQDEPAILAPKRTWRDLPVVSTVLPMARQGGQFAIAASVAVAMVLGVQQFNQPEAEQPFSAAPASVPGVLGGLSPVSLEQSRTVPRADMLEQRRRVNAYLTDHQQQLRIKANVQDEATDATIETNDTPEQDAKPVENIPK